MEGTAVQPDATHLILPGLAGDGLVHGFSTRRGGVSRPPFDTLNLGLSVGDDPARVRENQRRFFGTLGVGPEQVVRVRQAHGDQVLVVDDALARRAGFPGVLLDEAPRYDGLITDRPGLALVVSTADCHPLVLWDRRRGAVAAIHAGWRSTAKRLVSKTLARMRERYGTDPADCAAGIGPGIRGCCYEVDEPVMAAVRAATEDWAACVVPRGAGKWLLDLAAVNRRLLAEAGVPPSQTFDAGLCTACRRDLFFSYRAESARTGRMMNAVMMNA
jgi:YfiH family protein